MNKLALFNVVMGLLLSYTKCLGLLLPNWAFELKKMTVCSVLPLCHMWAIIVCSFCIIVNCIYGSAYVGTKPGPFIVKTTLYTTQVKWKAGEKQISKYKQYAL